MIRKHIHTALAVVAIVLVSCPITVAVDWAMHQAPWVCVVGGCLAVLALAAGARWAWLALVAACGGTTQQGPELARLVDDAAADAPADAGDELHDVDAQADASDEPEAAPACLPAGADCVPGGVACCPPFACVVPDAAVPALRCVAPDGGI